MKIQEKRQKQCSHKRQKIYLQYNFCLKGKMTDPSCGIHCFHTHFIWRERWRRHEARLTGRTVALQLVSWEIKLCQSHYSKGWDDIVRKTNGCIYYFQKYFYTLKEELGIDLNFGRLPRHVGRLYLHYLWRGEKSDFLKNFANVSLRQMCPKRARAKRKTYNAACHCAALRLEFDKFFTFRTKYKLLLLLDGLTFDYIRKDAIFCYSNNGWQLL